MKRGLKAVAAVGALLLAFAVTGSAFAQKQGGILRIYHRDSPASMSIHEEGTIGVIMPMMGVFNNLVIFDQHVPQNSMQSIVPELATSWAWSEDGKDLTFKLRDDVKWHDGKKFTAADVKCTFDLLTDQGQEKLRLNYRGSWWVNVAGVTTNGDGEATVHLKRPQPAVLAMLASGQTPMYPCHVPPREMRQHPIGTGPFKFVEYKPNSDIKARPQPGLLEAGPALSRRRRIHDHPEPLDGDPRLYRRQVRHDLPLGGHDPAVEGHQEPSAAGDCAKSARRARSIGMLINRNVPPFDNAGFAASDGADHRPKVLYRHSGPRPGRYRRR